MRNSWLPLLMLAGMSGFALTLVPWTSPLGIEGPQTPAGIYPLNEPFVAGAPDAAVSLRSTITELDEDPYAPAPLRDRRVGLEVVPWDQVDIVLEDRAATTRTLAKGLADHLSGYLLLNNQPTVIESHTKAGLVALSPYAKRSVPMAMRRIIRIRSITTSMPETTSGTMTASLLISLHDGNRPLVDAVTGLLPQTGIREGAWRVEVEVTGQTGDLGWIPWYVNWGRRLAGEVLATMQTAELHELAWDERGDRRSAIYARQDVGLLGGATAMPADLAWGDITPWPPGEGVERWWNSFQAPLVRGWSGAIEGVTTPHKLEITDTVEVFRQKVEKIWQLTTAADAERLIWKPPADAKPGPYSKLVAEQRSFGWEVAALITHPQPLAVVDAWLAAAVDGDDIGRTQLRRHLGCAFIDAKRSARMQAILRREPSAADLAALGRLADASETEQAAGAWVAWLRGIRSQVPTDALALPALSSVDPLVWDERPILLDAKGMVILVVALPQNRWGAYLRQPGTDQAARLVQGQRTASLALTEALSISWQDDGLRLKP